VSRWADRLAFAGGAAVFALTFYEWFARRFLWVEQ
jgi:hypothetical protein